MGDLNKMRLKHDRRVNFQIQLRHSIVVICYNVEVRENAPPKMIDQYETCFTAGT